MTVDVRPVWVRALKIAGVALGLGSALGGVFLLLILFPARLFPHHLEYGNLRVHAQTEVPRAFVETLEEIQGALRASSVYDLSVRHDILFGHGNRLYTLLQGGRWRITSLATGLRPALTYNESFGRSVSHVVTFRIPDFGNGALLSPDGNGRIDLAWTLTHELAHALVRSHLGRAATRLPMWKQEGYADHVAAKVASGRRASFWDDVEEVARHSPWMQALGDDVQPLRYGCQNGPAIINAEGDAWPICYHVARLLIAFLLDIEGRTFDEVTGLSVTDRETRSRLLRIREERSREVPAASVGRATSTRGRP